MTTIQIELSEATVNAARDAGLLTPQALERLLNDALKRQQAADALLSIADRVAAAGIEPMSMDEINAEVKAARAQRRQRNPASCGPSSIPTCSSPRCCGGGRRMRSSGMCAPARCR
jgi:hypothetical protein